LPELDQRTTNDYDRKQASTSKYYGQETSKCNKEAAGNFSKPRQGNRVIVSGDDYNLRESDRRNKNDYDREQIKYYGDETSECDEEADGNDYKYYGKETSKCNEGADGNDYNLRESYRTTTNDYDRKQRKYYGEETSKCDEEADSNSSKRRQGNRVTVSGDDYNLRELVQRNKNDYDRKQASTRKYYGQETSKCDEEAEADGNCSKRRRKHKPKNYYPKADGKQGNRVTVSRDDYNLRKSDRRTTKNDYDRKEASTRKYYGEETSECNEEGEADGNCSKWRQKHETKNYYPKADGKQGNRVTVSGDDYLCESDQRTTNDFDRKQASTRKYYGKETSDCDEEGEADEDTSKYDQESEEGRQASSTEYDGEDTSDTSECNEEGEADGDCSKRRQKHETKNYYPKADGKQGNRVTISRDDYNLRESDQ
jgi:hypothetical protein